MNPEDIASQYGGIVINPSQSDTRPSQPSQPQTSDAQSFASQYGGVPVGTIGSFQDQGSQDQSGNSWWDTAKGFASSLAGAFGFDPTQSNPNTAAQNDILGVGTLAGSPISAIQSYRNEMTGQDLDTQRGNLAESNLNLIRTLRTISDPTQRAKVQELIDSNMQQMSSLNDQARQAQSAELSPGSLMGSGLKSAASLVGASVGAPAASTVAGRIASAAGTFGTIGAAQGAGQAMTQNQQIGNVATSAGISGLFSALTAGTFQGIAEAAPSLVGWLTKGGQRGGQQILDTARLGTKNQLLNSSQTLQNSYESSIQSILKSPELSNVTVKPQDIFGDIATAMNEKGGSETAETIQKTIASVARNSRAFVSSDNLSLADANQFRKNIDQILRDSSFQKKLSNLPEKKQILMQARNYLQDYVQGSAEEALNAAGSPNSNALTNLFSKYSNEIKYYHYLKGTENFKGAITYGQLKGLLMQAAGPLGGAGVGGFEGYQTGGIPGAAAGALIGGTIGELGSPAGVSNLATIGSRIGGSTIPAIIGSKIPSVIGNSMGASQ